jgi:methionyl aminopeptidase
VIVIKSKDEIERVADACRIVAATLEALRGFVDEGLSTRELEKYSDDLISKKGGKAAFKGYRGFPASICSSVNDQVVHGIPSGYKLKGGDIVSVDIGVFYKGYYGDAAITLPVGEVSPEARRLMEATEESLQKGIEAATEGARVSDISCAVQKHVEGNGFSVVRAFVGHGIGKDLHEEPQIPNYGPCGRGARLRDGMTLAIEPMVNAGVPDVKVLGDGWTAVTTDGRLSAHFEHTVAVTGEGPRVLTKYV